MEEVDDESYALGHAAGFAAGIEAAAKVCSGKSKSIKGNMGRDDSWTNAYTESIGQYALCDGLAEAIRALSPSPPATADRQQLLDLLRSAQCPYAYQQAGHAYASKHGQCTWCNDRDTALDSIVPSDAQATADALPRPGEPAEPPK